MKVNLMKRVNDWFGDSLLVPLKELNTSNDGRQSAKSLLPSGLIGSGQTDTKAGWNCTEQNQSPCTLQ